jgi:toxin ParE1/3/4
MFEIWVRIAVDSPRAADRMVTRFYAAEDLLGEHPEIGEARPEIARDLRKWTVAPYVIFYRIAADAVEIVRFIHGAQDFSALFDP